MVDEVECFRLCFRRNWHNGIVGWGLKPNGSSFDVVGRNALNDELKLAKFVNNVVTNNHNWHGYPADYRNNPQDRPMTWILLLWRNNNIITKTHMRRIKKGQECRL
ncbi:MAG: hypothetical protein L0Y79_06965 [Chlorobi bacterium]|nr:hypothetical protein [Chlorobiota bacterium]MCI0715911.1 hypothetical protein [Chlorobiota bacterium]